MVSAYSRTFHMLSYRLPLISGLCAIIGTILIHYFDGNQNTFVDQDVYTRLNLVERFHQTGNWYDNTLPRDNPQHPETTQWSRLLDVVILGPGLIFGKFIGIKAGIFWWAAFISPIFFALGCIAIAWAAKPLLPNTERIFTSLLYLCQPTVVIYSMFGRPDHHGLLILLMTLSLGTMLKLVTEEESKPATALLAALAQSLAMAISIEAFVSTAVSYLILGISWLLNAPDAQRKAFWYSAGIAICSILFYLEQTPLQHWNFQELDRLSLSYIAFFLSLVVFWAVICRYSPKKKILASLIGGTLTLIIVELLNPKFVLGPTANIDPYLKKIWFSHIAEYTKLYVPLNNFPSMLILLLFPPLFAIPWSLHKIRNSEGNIRNGWTYLLMLCVLFFILTVFQSRWALYAQAVSVIPFASFIFACIHWLLQRTRRQLHSLARSIAILFFCCGNLVIGILVTPKKSNAKTEKPLSSIHEFCDWLNQQPFTQNQNPPQIIVASFNFGSEIVYRTPYSVIATGSHRNADGILYIHQLLNSDDLNQIYQDLKDRQISLILITYNVPDAPVDSKDKKSFYYMLHDNHLPPWITPVPMPEKLSQSYRLFRFNG